MIKEIRILNKANKLINSIASDSLAAGELLNRWVDKPAARRMNVWFPQTQALLLLSNDNVR